MIPYTGSPSEGPVALREVHSRGTVATGPAPGLISLMTPAATAALIRPATDIKDRPVMTQVEEDVPSTPTIDRLGSSLPQRTKGVPEEPDYLMDVGRNRSGIDMLKRFGNTLQVLEVATRFRFRSAQARERASPT